MNRTLMIILGAIFLITSCSYNQYEKDEVDTYLDWSGYWYYQGEENYDAYNRSRLLAERALNEEPDNLMAKLIYGYSLLKLRIWENENPRKNSAKKVFTEIIKDEKDNYRAHLGLGITNIKLCRKYTGKLRDFQILLAEIDKLMKSKGEIDKLREKKIDVDVNELQLVKDTNTLIELIRLVVAGEIFPYQEFKSLVKKDNPALSDIQEALGKRIEELIKSTDEAMLDYPFNYEFYADNLRKLRILFKVAEKYYKKEYVQLIEDAETEFKYCLVLHDKYERTYFWVYDYLSFLYAIKATLVQDNEKLKKEYHELEKDYLIKFINEDENFESKRRKKITSEDIEKLEENPFFSDVARDYQNVMVQLIDRAREVRQNKIITLVSLLANVFKDYTEAMSWVEKLKTTEERLSNPEIVDPFLYHYFRIKIYMLIVNKIENKNPSLARLAYISKSDKEKLSEKTLEKHRATWEEISDNAFNFMKKSSISKNEVERDEIDKIIMRMLERYPELYRSTE